MNRLTSRDGRDYLSRLPIELIELIFKFCADDCRGEPYRTFVQFQFLPGKTSYFEYTGEMRRGLPNGYGTLYHGSTRWDFIPERMPRGADFRQTIWMFQPGHWALSHPLDPSLHVLVLFGPSWTHLQQFTKCLYVPAGGPGLVLEEPPFWRLFFLYVFFLVLFFLFVFALLFIGVYTERNKSQENTNNML